MKKEFNQCQLSCGATAEAVATVCGYRLCQACIDRLRAIALDTGEPIDEGMVGGHLRVFKKRAFRKAERALEDEQERREIAAARRRAS